MAYGIVGQPETLRRPVRPPTRRTADWGPRSLARSAGCGLEVIQLRVALFRKSAFQPDKRRKHPRPAPQSVIRAGTPLPIRAGLKLLRAEYLFDSGLTVA